ncbi:hypothetical protein ONZ45_g18657 [Pleurotus djamor]|nr:hypothetical protein ONZ45_g18657 [Pleurotus djamor]
MSTSTMAATWILDIPGRPQISAEAESIVSETHNAGAEGESIIGGIDARERINAIDFADGGKYRSVVKIQSRFNSPNGEVWMMGTGWLVNADTLITAGHVVYDRSYGFGACTQLKCYVGFDGVDSIKEGAQPRYGQYVATTQNWATPTPSGLNDRPHNVAFIRVHKPFVGNLNVFKFADTEPSASLMLGVVGYPGDKDLKGEKGAEMYGEFVRTTFDLNTDKLHMITYFLSTYGGQSGAPVIAKTKEGLVVIGTHCYGAGNGIPGNSGNSIGGKWGNPYTKYLNLFNQQKTSFAPQTNKIRVVPLDSVAVPSDPRNPPAPSPVKPPTPRTPVDPVTSHNPSPVYRPSDDNHVEEGFFDVLKSIARVGSSVVTAGAPFLGPIGSIVAPVAGGLLGAIAGQESTISAVINRSGEPIAPGTAERAVLAEASLQGVLNLLDQDPNHPVLQTVLSDMSKQYLDYAPKVDEIAMALAPQLTECALDIAGFKFDRAVKAPQSQEATVDLTPKPLTGIPLGEAGGIDEPFVEGLLSATVPVAGAEEGAFDFLGGLITKAVSVAKPLVSRAAKYAVTDIIPHLLNGAGAESSFESTTTVSPAAQSASQLVFKRALVADAALTALRKLPRDQLNQLKVTSVAGQSQEEGIFDFIKSTVQKIGPYALGAAKTAIKNIAPTLIDAAASKIKERMGVPLTNGSSSTESVRTLKRQPSKMSVNGSRLMAASDDLESTLSLSVPPSPRIEVTSLKAQPSVSHFLNPDQPPFTTDVPEFDA